MGTTYIDKDTFMEYIESLRQVYRAQDYHLLGRLSIVIEGTWS